MYLLHLIYLNIITHFHYTNLLLVITRWSEHDRRRQDPAGRRERQPARVLPAAVQRLAPGGRADLERAARRRGGGDGSRRRHLRTGG